jgi:histidyl-tRNA synthetase
MGDVVLSLVLQDRGLMPPDSEIMRRTGCAPDVFVISNGTPDTEALLKPFVARCRALGMHTRHTYKATRNVGKLLKEAADSGARVAVILESAASATVKDLATGQQTTTLIEGLPDRILAERR